MKAIILFAYGVATLSVLITLAVLGRIQWSSLIIGMVIGIAASVGKDLILSRRLSAKRNTDNHTSK